MARFELSAEVRAIESLIDAGEHGSASSKLQAAHNNLGWKPEYRYLLCLYDSTFRVRPDGELLRDVIELVGEQPDLMEATALLAQLYSRTGDEARADLFARLALESPNPSARARATEVLDARANDVGDPPSSRIKPIERPFEPVEASAPISSTRPADTQDAPPSSPEAPPSSAPLSTSEPTELGAWFDRARRNMVHRRSPTYGVRSELSIAEMLLDWGKTVAEGTSFVSDESLPLNRESLAKVDESILALRRQPGSRSAASRSDTSRPMAAAGFFLAVVLHELEATVLEIAAADGGCKVVLPSGAGTRPLLVAAAFAEGNGPSLVQTFDRLAAARELASGASPSDASFRRATSIPAVRQPVFAPAPSSGSVHRDELALTRPEAEATPVRRLDGPTEAADLPPLDLAALVAALADSPLGEDIAAHSGTALTPTPHSIQALDSHCLATHGEPGAAPERPVWQPSDDDEELILAGGALLGETLIATYGGIWESDPNAPSDPRLFRVICEERVAAWPMTQVYLRLKNGARHSLAEFVATVGRLLE